MARRSGTSWDFLGFSLLNAMLHPVSSDPGGLVSGDKGRVWFNTTSNRLMVWSGTTAIDLLLRSNHQGTQLASSISDLATTVQAYRLDQFAVPTADINLNSHKLINVTDGTGAQDAATKGQLDAALASLASGQVLKGTVKVAALTNINIASAPGTIDGITVGSGDVVLLTAQSTGSQNGPYVSAGSGAAMTRATNWDTSGEAVLGSYWIVQQGTNADTFALMTNDTAITLGTTTPLFTFRGAAGASYTAGGGIGLSGTDFSVAAGTGLTQDADGLSLNTAIAVRKAGGAIPAATAGIFTITGATVVVNHALSNSAPFVSVVAGGTPASGYTTLKPVEMDWEATDANNVTITLPAAPLTSNWIVTVIG